MKMDNPSTLADPACALAADAASGHSQQVYQQLGSLTRVLHDALEQLGVMPNLQNAADGLPDARSRLGYIANKTAEAAEKVLNQVDDAKAEQAGIASLAQSLAQQLGQDTGAPLDRLALARTVAQIESRSTALDGHLTNIMMAQDFHDLTGQVVAKVVTLAIDLEDNLLKLLLQAVPEAQRVKAVPAALAGPVVSPEGRTDVVADQGEVDDLLASLGF